MTSPRDDDAAPGAYQRRRDELVAERTRLSRQRGGMEETLRRIDALGDRTEDDLRYTSRNLDDEHAAELLRRLRGLERSREAAKDAVRRQIGEAEEREEELSRRTVRALRDAPGDTSSLGSGPLGLGCDGAVVDGGGTAPSGDPDRGALPRPAAAPVSLVRERDGLRLEVGRGPLSMGRSATCDLHVGGNPSVSRVHATVSAAGRGIAVCDQGSANGTFVGGSRIEPRVACEVARGEAFALGDERFRVV